MIVRGPSQNPLVPGRIASSSTVKEEGDDFGGAAGTELENEELGIQSQKDQSMSGDKRQVNCS